jgi:hypothetical protein
MNVESKEALQDAINNASPFNTIVLTNGNYKNSTFHISTGNITVMSATPVGVFFNGKTIYLFQVII